MLLGNFYTIQSIKNEEATAIAIVEFNIQHSIFSGHFPGQPIVPGACLLQIVKEMMETIKGISLQLKKANQIKFLSIVDPTKNSILEIVIKHRIDENNEINVSATFSHETIIYCKFNGTFRLAT